MDNFFVWYEIHEHPGCMYEFPDSLDTRQREKMLATYARSDSKVGVKRLMSFDELRSNLTLKHLDKFHAVLNDLAGLYERSYILCDFPWSTIFDSSRSGIVMLVKIEKLESEFGVAFLFANNKAEAAQICYRVLTK